MDLVLMLIPGVIILGIGSFARYLREQKDKPRSTSIVEECWIDPASVSAKLQGCPHAIIEPVMASGETDPVAWICLNPECYDQLELTDPAVRSHLRREKLEQGWKRVGDQMTQEPLKVKRAPRPSFGVQYTTQEDGTRRWVPTFSSGGYLKAGVTSDLPDMPSQAELDRLWENK